MKVSKFLVSSLIPVCLCLVAISLLMGEDPRWLIFYSWPIVFLIYIIFYVVIFIKNKKNGEGNKDVIFNLILLIVATLIIFLVVPKIDLHIG